MADPSKFTPGYDYSDFEASQPNKPKPGVRLDTDFANVATSIDEIVEAVKDVRRSDGALKNGIVTIDALEPSLGTDLQALADQVSADAEFVAQASDVIFAIGDNPDGYSYDVGIAERAIVGEDTAGPYPSITLQLEEGPAVSLMKMNAPAEVALQKADTVIENTIDLTVYVSPTGNDTLNTGLTVGSPFLTLNRAESFLPKVTFDRQQIVSMSAGTHNESFTPAADMARAAILMPGQRLRRKRTDGDGAGGLEGAVVYRGQGVASTYVETNPGAGYGYGLYLTSAEAAFQDFTVRPAASGATQALSTVHRTAYGHFLRVNFDGAAGAGVGLGAIVEAGGFMEAVDCQFTGASSLDLLVYNPGSASIAGVAVATKIGKAQVNGTLNLVGNVEVTDSMLVGAGAYLSTQISGSLRPKFSGTSFTVSAGGRAYLTNTDITVPITARGDMRLDACNITAPIIADGCVVRLNAVTTVGMTDPRPLVSTNGGRFVIDSTSDIKNNALAAIGDRTFITLVSPAANGGVISIPAGKHTFIKISATGANRTGWTFAATPSGGFPGQPFGHGDRLTVIGGGFSTQLLTGNGFTFPGGAIQVSRNIPGTYSGFEAIYDADGGYWLVTALGTLF